MSSQKKHPEHKAPKGARTSRSTSTDSGVGNLIQSALFGALIGLLSATLLLFAATAVCYATADPAALATPSALISLYLSALIGGFAALRRHRSLALACGSLCGMFLMLVFLALSLLLRNQIDNGFPFTISLLIRVLMIPVAAFGGYLGLPRNTRKKRHSR